MKYEPYAKAGVSFARAIRGELPPPPGTSWTLAGHCYGELMTNHPLLGAHRHRLRVQNGRLRGLRDRQFEITLGLSPGELVFRSTSILRPETFRYLAKGDLTIGGAESIVVMRIHDLSWIMRGEPSDDTRVLTLSASIDRRVWSEQVVALPAPWLTRDRTELFVHSEWIESGGDGG